MKDFVNSSAWIPSHNNEQKHIYILLTSLNLGGAEKIVSDQLWANYYQKFPHKVTLIVIYDKNKEHSIPPDVNVVRLNNNIKNGEVLLKQISYEKKPLVCHLINDHIANYLISLSLNIHIVVHNDKKGWSNSPEIFNHPNVISLISICKYVSEQLREITNKKIYTVRHQINYSKFSYNFELRNKYRTKLGLSEKDILIGMTGRICLQKNYFLALDIIAFLSRKNSNYKLVIIGGFEPAFSSVYFELLNKANKLGIQKNVIFTGFKDNAYEWLNAFDIGLNVSHFEGLSMASQEIIMNGLQMVLSDVSGQKEILDLNNQLHFFNLPEEFNNVHSKELNIDLPHSERNIRYLNLVSHIAGLIESNHSKRIEYDNEQHEQIDLLTYGSHNIWSLFNFIYPQKKSENVNSAFITTNLNLGGAQRSLVNLMIELKKDNKEIPLILLNQSNYFDFYNEIIKNNIDYFLCHSRNDVFCLSAPLLDYIEQHEINRLILWNVDAKMKIIISKLLSHKIEIIDVSPGDYCFIEMDNQKIFQDALYFSKEEYFENLHSFVSKFDNSNSNEAYKSYLKNDTIIIPNGVPILPEYIKKHNLNKKDSSFKFIICGRITESKHIDKILTAFSLLYKNNPNIIIDLYGSAETYDEEYYNKLLSDFSTLINKGVINFKGNTDNVRAVMCEYDCIIVLGTHQGSPNVVLEAVACKLPCITNDSGGTKEIINNETGILLATIPDMEKLFNAMLYTLNNYQEMIERSEKAYSLIIKDFSMDKMKESYLKIIC